MPTKILRPTTGGAYNDYSFVGAANVALACDPGDPIAHDEDASHTDSGTNNKQTFKILPASLPSGVFTVQSLDIYARSRGSLQSHSPMWRFAGADTFLASVGLAAGYADYGPYGIVKSPQFTQAELSNLEFGLRTDTAGSLFTTSCWVILTYAEATQIESAREIGSRRLRMRRLANGLIEVVIPSLEYIDQELLDLMALSHPELPALDGLGAGVKPWQRWPCVKVRSETRWESGSEVVQLRDLRDILCTYWDVGKSLRASAAYLDGVARLSSATRGLDRSTVGWVVGPSGDRVTQLASNTERVDKDGLLIESASTNEVIQSAFKNGSFTGWTVSGSGTIAPDSSDVLFESTVSGQSAKLTANATISSDLQAQGTATRSFSANAIVRASLWHKDDSGAAMSYAIQRAFDSQWWRDSDQTWQASKTWNALPITSSRARHKSKQINVGANATTLTLFFGVPTTGVGGQVNHCYHVQIEEKKFASSTIPTEAVAFTRAAEVLTISNPSQSPSWPPDRGLFRCYVVPLWDAADVSGVNKTVWFVLHDSSNYDWIYYDGANARWVFERMAAGATYRAVKSASPVAGTAYRIAARWTSALQEQGLAARTLSIFVDGVKGTDVTAAALETVTASTVQEGSKNSVEQADAAIWGVEIIQQAPDDAFVVRF